LAYIFELRKFWHIGAKKPLDINLEEIGLFQARHKKERIPLLSHVSKM